MNNRYNRLNEYRLIEVDNVWDPWDDKVYMVTYFLNTHTKIPTPFPL